jgi:hypothetical protein
MSGSTAQALGILSLIWGGTKLNVESKSSSFSPGGLINATQVAGKEITFSQSFVASSVKASFPLKAGMSLATLKSYNNSELQVQCDSGQTYTISGAVIIKDTMVKGGAGNNVSLEWSGQPATEVVS